MIEIRFKYDCDILHAPDLIDEIKILPFHLYLAARFICVHVGSLSL